MRVLLFSPFSYIYQHSYPEHLIGESLSSKGHDVVFMRCDGVLNKFCPSMEAAGLLPESSDEKKKKICAECQGNSVSFDKKSSYKTVYIGEFLTLDDFNLVDALIALESGKKTSAENFEFDGTPFGRICSYELILHFKKMSIECLDDKQKAYFYAQLRGSLLSYLAMKNHLKTEKYSHALIYSPQYAINHSASIVLEQLQVPVYFIESGTNNFYRLSTMRLWKWNEFRLVNPLLSRWSRIKNITLSESDAQKVVKHYQTLMLGNSIAVYSEAYKGSASIREIWSIPSEKKILLAAMSSYDEAYAAYVAGLFPSSKVESSVFKDQLEWIQETIKFVASRNDLFLIVRVHPRDFPNKRESGKSDQARLLVHSLNSGGINSVVNWPEEKISIYDLYLQSDVLLTGWSITALEASIVGVPVVTYDRNLPSYPEDMMYTGSTREEYFQNILSAVRKKDHSQKSYFSFKWMALNHSFGVAEICKKFHLIQQQKSKISRVLDVCLRKIFRVGKLTRFLNANDANEGQLDLVEKMLLLNSGTFIDLVSEGVSSEHPPSDYSIIEGAIAKIRGFLGDKKRSVNGA